MDLGENPSPFFCHARKNSTGYDLSDTVFHDMLILSFGGEVCKLRKLLIADSSEIFTGALTAALGDRFDIHVCGDGPSALDALQQEQPDILILNLLLPYKDGLTFCRKALISLRSFWQSPCI